jgi:hypothetical protein
MFGEGAMTDRPIKPPALSALRAGLEARRQHEVEAEKESKRKADEQQADLRRRLDNFEVTDADRQMINEKIKQAFERNEKELMFASFPSEFCTDGGRAIINAHEPPLNPPPKEQKDNEPDWVATLPMGFRRVYQDWKEHLKPGGYNFSARIVSYPDGKPGDVGLFFSWSIHTDTGAVR